MSGLRAPIPGVPGMGTLWRIIPCPCRWWQRCGHCRGTRKIAVALTERELRELCYTTFSGELYRSRETAEAAIRRMG